MVDSTMTEIEQCLPEGGQWCSIEKARWIAQHLLTISVPAEAPPPLVVEIGVWMGGSLLPMLIALRDGRNHGKVIAIDPWDRAASAAGETERNAHWWGYVDHEGAFATFTSRLRKHRVEHLCEIWRSRSDDVTPPVGVDLLHIDGNHTDQAVRDAQRFLPGVKLGGLAILDDVGWEGGHVERAVEVAASLGFEHLRPLGTGIVMKRTFAP